MKKYKIPVVNVRNIINLFIIIVNILNIYLSYMGSIIPFFISPILLSITIYFTNFFKIFGKKKLKTRSLKNDILLSAALLGFFSTFLGEISVVTFYNLSSKQVLFGLFCFGILIILSYICFKLLSTFQEDYDEGLSYDRREQNYNFFVVLFFICFSSGIAGTVFIGCLIFFFIFLREKDWRNWFESIYSRYSIYCFSFFIIFIILIGMNIRFVEEIDLSKDMFIFIFILFIGLIFSFIGIISNKRLKKINKIYNSFFKIIIISINIVIFIIIIFFTIYKPYSQPFIYSFENNLANQKIHFLSQGPIPDRYRLYIGNEHYIPGNILSLVFSTFYIFSLIAFLASSTKFKYNKTFIDMKIEQIHRSIGYVIFLCGFFIVIDIIFSNIFSDIDFTIFIVYRTGMISNEYQIRSIGLWLGIIIAIIILGLLFYFYVKQSKTSIENFDINFKKARFMNDKKLKKINIIHLFLIVLIIAVAIGVDMSIYNKINSPSFFSSGRIEHNIFNDEEIIIDHIDVNNWIEINCTLLSNDVVELYLTSTDGNSKVHHIKSKEDYEYKFISESIFIFGKGNYSILRIMNITSGTYLLHYRLIYDFDEDDMARISIDIHRGSIKKFSFPINIIFIISCLIFAVPYEYIYNKINENED